MDDNQISCPNCGKKIADGIPFCPHCGARQKQSLSKEDINKNPYEILQVAEGADPEVIEAAYRSLARKYHPDSGASSVSEERMREINWAHGILSDPDKLAEWKLKHIYNQLDEKKPAQPTSTEKPGNPPASAQTTSSPSTPPTTSSRRSGSNPSPPTKNRFPTGLVIIIIVVVAVILLISYLSVQYPGSPVPTDTFIPTNTPFPTVYLPTVYNSPIPTPTQGIQCILWSDLTISDVGQYECVYGRIVNIYSSGNDAQIVRFSREAGTFMIWDPTMSYININIGDCVASIGVVQRNASSLYMDITNSKLYSYTGCQ